RPKSAHVDQERRAAACSEGSAKVDGHPPAYASGRSASTISAVEYKTARRCRRSCWIVCSSVEGYGWRREIVIGAAFGEYELGWVCTCRDSIGRSDCEYAIVASIHRPG